MSYYRDLFDAQFKRVNFPKVLFSQGYLFGDELDITASDLALIPSGAPVSIDE